MAEEMQALIARITGEVLKHLSPPEEKAGGTLAVFPGYVFDEDGVAEYLKESYRDVTCSRLDIMPSGCGCKTEKETPEKESLAGKLKGYEKIVIVTPPLWLLHAMACGDDTVYAAMLALRPLLWGREVTVLLDFETPKNRRSPAFLRIAEDIGALEEMGIRIAYLRQVCEESKEAKDLVTEQDVKEASGRENRCIKVSPGAIVTQLAQDTAKELGVTIGM